MTAVSEGSIVHVLRKKYCYGLSFTTSEENGCDWQRLVNDVNIRYVSYITYYTLVMQLYADLSWNYYAFVQYCHRCADIP